MNPILEGAIREHKPRRIVALTSGGMDSTAAMLEAREVIDFAAYIDTGTALPGCEEHVQSVCDKLGVHLKVYRTPEKVYNDMVLEHGFPGPPQHGIMYRNLKERRVRDIVREEKREWKDRILLITGVRASESVRRMGTVKEVQRTGAQVWVAPIIGWDKQRVIDACAAGGITQSDVTALTHRSGECNCGAYAAKGEREEIKSMFPKWFANRIAPLEEACELSGKPCVWGAKTARKKKPGREVSVGQMCMRCEVEND